MLEQILRKLLSLVIMFLYILIIFIAKIIELLDKIVSSVGTQEPRNALQSSTSTNNMTETGSSLHDHNSSPLDKALGELKSPYRLRDFSGETIVETLEVRRTCSLSLTESYIRQEILDKSITQEVVPTLPILSSQCIKHEDFTFFRSVGPKTSRMVSLDSAPEIDGGAYSTQNAPKARKDLKMGCILCFFTVAKSSAVSPASSLAGDTTETLSHEATKLASFTSPAYVSLPEEEEAKLGHICASTKHENADTKTRNSSDKTNAEPVSAGSELPTRPVSTGHETQVLASPSTKVESAGSVKTVAMEKTACFSPTLTYPIADMQCEDSVSAMQTLAMEIFLPEEEGSGLHHVFPFLGKLDGEDETWDSETGAESTTESEEIMGVLKEPPAQALDSEKKEDSNSIVWSTLSTKDVVSPPLEKPSGLARSDETIEVNHDTFDEEKLEISDLDTKVDESCELLTPPADSDNGAEGISFEEGCGLGHVFPFLGQATEDDVHKAEDTITGAILEKPYEGGAEGGDNNKAGIDPASTNVAETHEDDAQLVGDTIDDNNDVAFIEEDPNVEQASSHLSRAECGERQAKEQNDNGTEVQKARPLEHSRQPETQSMTSSSSSMPNDNEMASQNIPEWEHSQHQDHVALQHSRFNDKIKQMTEAKPQQGVASSEHQDTLEVDQHSDGDTPSSKQSKIFTDVSSPVYDQITLSPISPKLDPEAIDLSWSPKGSVEFNSGISSDGMSGPTGTPNKHYDDGTPTKKKRSTSATNMDTIVDRRSTQPSRDAVSAQSSAFPAPAGCHAWPGLTASKIDTNRSEQDPAKVMEEEEAKDTAAAAESAKMSKTLRRRQERKKAKAAKKAMAEATKETL